MLSKEEIEKTKELLSWVTLNKFYIDLHDEVDYHKVHNSIETLLQYIKELEADNYECNNIINDYIEERHKLIDIMKADRMEQFDDYVIYLIEKYLKELGALEDE